VALRAMKKRLPLPIHPHQRNIFWKIMAFLY